MRNKCSHYERDHEQFQLENRPVPDEDEIIQGLHEYLIAGKLFMRYSIKMDFKTIHKI